MYHALALLMLAVVFERLQNNYLHYAGMFFIGGVILFSGSLYLMASLQAMNKEGLSGIGIITPIGGLLFITGWVLFLVGILKK